jgi:hypothetical protein
MRYAVLLVVLVAGAAIATAKPPQEVGQNSGGRTIPCKTPANASMCYWTRGRLQFYNGTPSYRLWKIGTKQLLGIYSGPGADLHSVDNENPEFPANVQRIWQRRISQRVFADFEVCPLEPERSGWMQAACVESAKNLFVQE